MGINKIACCVILLFNYGIIAAQKQNKFPLQVKSDAGSWKIEQFISGIIKIAFDPTGYIYNEQVSNAVIGKPVGQLDQGTAILTDSDKKGFSVFFAEKRIRVLGYFDSAGHRGFRFGLAPGEKIMGTGERSVPMNRRGYKLQLYNNPAYGYGLNAENLNYSVPFFISSNGFGIFFDNPSKGYFDIGKNNPGILEYGASSGKLNFYIIPGSNVAEILRRYHALTGTQPLPARWVFGNLMSRFGYRSQEQVTSTVSSMLEQHFPVDAVILDLFWFGDSIKGTLGNLDWVNKAAWPAPEKMISDLSKQGIKTILITEPFVLQTTPNYEPSKKLHATDSAGNPFVLTNFYFGNGGLLDIFRKETQDWFWSKYKKQINIGVAGWWGDLGEPETHPENLYHNLKDLGFKRAFRAHEVHNIYGHYWDKMLYDKYAKEYPGTRLFNLNRSGYAGSARYGVFPWSGDVSRSWEGLQAQLPLMIGMSMSGVPYIHADAGGFAGGEGDKELYTRWLQFATFTPVFRPHGTAFGNLEPGVKDIPSEAAFYDEPYKSIVRNSIGLRYQLLPYNYTLGYEQAKFGKLLVRPLFYYDNADSNLYKTDNQFMWGDAFMIAPVLKKDARSLALYLPQGSWYQYHREEKLAGGRWITEELTLDNIPVFVKAGSFIPMFKPSSPIKNTGEYSGKKIFVKYYPSALSSRYILYEDDGRTNNTIANGNYELIQFEGLQKSKTLTIRIKMGNKKILQAREFVIELPMGFHIKAARVNSQLAKVTDNKIFLPYSGKPLNLEVSLR